jgi:pilus assembly protein Flp/PilA
MEKIQFYASGVSLLAERTLCDSQIMKMIRKFLADESGATAIEYGLIAAGIAVAIIAAVIGLGTRYPGTS